MADIKEVLAFMERDPIAGYIAIAIVGARPPNPRIIVELAGRNLVLPDWTGLEWAWYGAIANDYGDKRHVSGVPSGDAIRKAQRKLAPLLSRMKSLLNDKPAPKDAAAFYDSAVRVVIAANSQGVGAAGPTFVQVLKESLVGAPATIGQAIAAVVGTGADVLKPVAQEALKIAGDIFGAVVKSGIGAIAIVALALYWYVNRKE